MELVPSTAWERGERAASPRYSMTMLPRGPLPIPIHGVFLSLMVAILLGGCGTAPKVEATGARPVSRTEGAAEFRIDLRLSNAGKKDIPLERFEYSLIVDGVGRFNGRWAALTTIPPGNSIDVEIPAAILIPADIAQRLDLSAPVAWRIEGGVRYQSSGLFGRILFDVGIRRPTQRFAGSGTFTLEQSDSSANAAQPAIAAEDSSLVSSD